MIGRMINFWLHKETLLQTVITDNEFMNVNDKSQQFHRLSHSRCAFLRAFGNLQRTSFEPSVLKKNLLLLLHVVLGKVILFFYDKFNMDKLILIIDNQVDIIKTTIEM